MKLSAIIHEFERIAPPSLQESYDNSGLIVGDSNAEVSKALLCLDSTVAIIDEAIQNGCDLIVAHHPIVFKGLKRFNGTDYVQRAVIKAIRNNIAIYACHTNLDNVLQQGVNAKIAEKLGLTETRILSPHSGKMRKLAVYVPNKYEEVVRDALFAVGAGQIGNYDECSFSIVGSGTFRAGETANPYVGKVGARHIEAESKLEVVFPEHLESEILKALRMVHPYEEIAMDLHVLQNSSSQTGSGIVGKLPKAFTPQAFLNHLKITMDLVQIRFTNPNVDLIETVAVCGGSGSFLIGNALKSGAQAFVTSDIKYHEFFDAEDRLMLCDIGHFESEKYTTEIFAEILSEKFPNFATILPKTLTNPVNYYF